MPIFVLYLYINFLIYYNIILYADILLTTVYYFINLNIFFYTFVNIWHIYIVYVYTIVHLLSSDTHSIFKNMINLIIFDKVSFKNIYI